MGSITTVGRTRYRSLSQSQPDLRLTKQEPKTTWYVDQPDGAAQSSSLSRNGSLRFRTRINVFMKMKNLRDKIKAEQSVKENDQHEYRRLSHSKHSSKLTRLKQVFETKNRKSSDKIEKLQKRLQEYEAKVKNYEENNNEDQQRSRLHRYSSESNLLQTRGAWTNKTGDQPASLIINRMYSPGTVYQQHSNLQQQISSDQSDYQADRSNTSESGIGINNSDVEGNSSMNSSINNLSTKVILAEVADMRTELERVQKNVEKDREDLMKELKNVSDEFQEYKIRHDDLDYQISTMNELRQTELVEWRHSVDEKHDIMEYQSQEKMQDLRDHIIALETRISKLEHQSINNQDRETLIQIENENARAWSVQAMNIVLVLLQMVLIFIGTIAHILRPFVKSSFRIACSAVLIFILYRNFYNWKFVSLDEE